MGFNRKTYMKQYIKQWRKDNPEYIKQYYKDNEEHIKQHRKQYYKDNSERLNKNRRQDYKKNGEKIKEWTKQWQKNNPDKMKAIRLKHYYGLSHENWLKMWDNQEGRCAICGEFFSNPSEAFVDHDHITGEIRGLLCKKCNFGLGNFNDNPEIMKKAIKYIRGSE